MKNLLVTLDVEGRSQGLLRKDNKTYFRNSLITICTEKRMNQDCWCWNLFGLPENYSF